MSNPGSILAIDDQAVLLMNMAVTLEAEGYAVDTAIDESSALATAASTHPDVFLVDLRLGKSDGVNLISQLREICPDSIYVVMSAYADTDSTIRAMQNGAHDYLTKPFGDEELKLLINRSFQRLHLAREKTRAEEDLRTTNQELLRLNNRLRLMVETVRKIPAGSSPEEESRTMFVEFARAMHANGGSLYVRREGELFRLHALDPQHSPESVPLPLEPGSVLARGFESRGPVFVEEIVSESELTGSGWTGYSDGSLMSFPLLTADGPIEGVVNLHNPAGKPFTTQDLDLGIIFSSLILEALHTSRATEQLREREERFRSLIENSTDLIVMVDADGVILYESPSVFRILGHRAGEMIGRNIGEVIHPDDLRDAEEALARALKNESEAARFLVRTRHSNGSWRLLEFAGVNRLENPAMGGIVLNGRDVTEQVEARNAVDYRLKFENLMTSISTDLINLSSDDIDEGIREAVRRLGGFVEVDRCYVFLFSHDGAEISCLCEWCRPGIAPQREQMQDLPVSEHYPWFAERITNGEVVYIPRVADLPPEAAAEKKGFEHIEVQSMVGVPMVSAGSVVGFLGFDAAVHEKQWSDDVITLLKIIGEMFVNALTRKDAESALETSELRYRSLFEKAGDGLFLYDGVTVIDCNPETLRMFGCTRDEMIGRPQDWFFPVTQPDGRDSAVAAADLLAAAASGHEQRFEWLHKRRDGSLFFGEVTLTPVVLPEGTRVMAILRDTSERREAEDQLRESETKYRTLFERSPALNVILDADLRIVDLNNAFAETLGYTKDELVGTSAIDYFRADERDKALSRAPQLFDGSRIPTTVWHFLARDGSVRALITPGGVRQKVCEGEKLLGVLVQQIDVTDLEEAQTALDYRLRFESLIVSLSTRFINLPVGEIDAGIRRALDQLGRFVEVDRTFVFLFSEDREEMSCEFEWCLEGISPQREHLQNLRIGEHFPWFAERIKNLEVVYVPRVSDLPPEAAMEKAEFEREEIQSLIDVPMVYSGELLGFLGFETVRSEKQFSDDIITLLKMVGEMFVNALARKEFDAALEASELRYRSLFENAGDAAFLFDGLTVVDCNPETLRMFGCTREEMIGLSPDWFFPEKQPDGRNSAAAATELLRAATSEERRFEWLLRRRDGSPFLGEVMLTPVALPEGVRVLAIARDISERKEAEDQLRNSEQKHRSLFENSPTLHLITAPDETIVDVNQAFLNATGYTRKELLDGDIPHLVVPGQRERARERMRIALGGASLGSAEWTVVARDGSRRILHEPASTGKQVYEGNRLIGVFMELTDVTELRAAESREREQREQLYQAAKLVSLGTLLSGVAHEINNPNNFIRMSVDNLKDFWTDAETILDRVQGDTGSVTLGGLPYERSRDMATKMLASIRDGSERIEKLVSDLKNFARKGDAREHEVVDLREILDTAISIVRSTITKATSRFEFETPSRPIRIRCDRHQIEQIIMNLVTNSCQALESRDAGISIVVKCAADTPWVEVVVSDEGKGIPPDAVQQVTDPFFTTKRGEGGTGLGLAVSHRIASDHGGTLEFESAEGKGTVATLRLPIQRQNTETESDAEATVE